MGVAAALGVSHMALYKHVPSLAALKHMVAEEIFTRWQIPRADEDLRGGLEAYLDVFAASVHDFVRKHPGLTPNLIRRLAATQPMLAKIDAHQTHVSQAFDIPKERARWLLLTVAFHGMAVADTCTRQRGRSPSRGRTERRRRPRWRPSWRRECRP